MPDTFNQQDGWERLIRVRASRRDETVFLRVQYEKVVQGSGTTLRIVTVEPVD